MVSSAFILATPLSTTVRTKWASTALTTARRGRPVHTGRKPRMQVEQPTPATKTHQLQQADEETPTLRTAQTPNLENLPLLLTAASLGFLTPGIEATQAAPQALVDAFASIPASLLHPATMGVVTGTALYTFYLGYQSSRIRKVSPEERKELVQAKFTDRHFRTSSALFAVMTVATFTGMANTYTRAGKLFPGPHLYAGLSVIAILSVMSSFVPYMQKGKSWARDAHFAGAIAVTGLLGWQAKSGVFILGKLLKWW